MPESHRAVCRSGGDKLGAATGYARPEPPGKDVLAALQPQVIRRHRLLRVLLDQRGERVEVVALEGRDVAGEELALPIVHGRHRIGGADAARLQRHTSTLQRAVHRRHARVEELGDLLCLPAQDFAQDQHRPLARGKMLERRHEGKPDRVAGHSHLCWITLRRKQAVRDRLDPRRLRKRVEVRRIGSSGRAEIHRTRPARAPIEHVEADVRRDPVEPRAQGGATLEAIETAPSP